MATVGDHASLAMAATEVLSKYAKVICGSQEEDMSVPGEVVKATQEAHPGWSFQQAWDYVTSTHSDIDKIMG